MFWAAREDRIQKALSGFAEKYELSEDSREKLKELTEWLAETKQEAQEEWTHDELFEMLLGEQEFDKDFVMRAVLDNLRFFQEFAITLVDKLSAFHGTLTDEQKFRIREAFDKRGKERHVWRGRHGKVRHGA